MPTENRSSNTEQMVSVPTECQFHNNCGGWCETPRQVEHNLCEHCLEAHDEDRSKGYLNSCKAVSESFPFNQSAAQHQGEPVVLPERMSSSKVKAAGWNECLAVIAKLGPLYRHPPTSDGFSAEQMTAQGADGYRNGIKAAAELAEAYPDLAQAIRALPLPQ